MPEAKVESTCHLCKMRRPLRKSHVFPEFLYKHTYDDKHSYDIVNLEGQWISSARQIGIWERLLCDECERRLNKLETYSSNILHRLARVQVRDPESNEACILVLDVDYRRFKLFLLSLIWRASLSSRVPFAGIVLGEHEENIRQMLLAGDPRDAGCYPSVLRMFRRHREDMRSAIMAPFKVSHNDVTAYRTYFLGIVCTTYMLQSAEESRLDGVLRETGDLPIKIMTPIQEDAIVYEIGRGLPVEDEGSGDV